VSLALQYVNESWFAAFVDLGAILGMTTVILVMAYGHLAGARTARVFCLRQAALTIE
jgi:hypothetical protein